MSSTAIIDSAKHNTDAQDLHAPIQLGALTLRNRIVMAPLTRNRAGDGNVPQALNVEYYRQRASAGLIITEATQIAPQGVGYPNTPGIHSQAQIDGWREITNEVHARGGQIVLQLWHVGRISHPSLQPDGALPVAPSAIKPEGEVVTYDGSQPFVTPRALEFEEIPAIVEAYRQAALNAKAAGFDGVEVHAANGYLLDQFLRDGTNTRSDAYGGSVENRSRLALEVVEAVTEVWCADRVGVRISPTGTFNSMSDSDPQATFEYVVSELDRFGLAYLHVVENFGPEAATVDFDWSALRQIFRGAYMANGGYERDTAVQSLADGKADLVSFGQLFLANPDLVERFAQNAPLNVADRDTFYGGDHRGYTDYPRLPATVLSAA